MRILMFVFLCSLFLAAPSTVLSTEERPESTAPNNTKPPDSKLSPSIAEEKKANGTSPATHNQSNISNSTFEKNDSTSDTVASSADNRANSSSSTNTTLLSPATNWTAPKTAAPEVTESIPRSDVANKTSSNANKTINSVTSSADKTDNSTSSTNDTMINSTSGPTEPKIAAKKDAVSANKIDPFVSGASPKYADKSTDPPSGEAAFKEVSFEATSRARDADDTPIRYKSVVEKIQNLSINNSFVVKNWINLKLQKSDISRIGEPFDLSSLQNLTFRDSFYVPHGNHINFTNIVANYLRVFEPAPRMNRFVCTFSKQLQINVSLIPEDMLIEGQIRVMENATSKISLGSFKLNSRGNRLIYNVPYMNDNELKKMNITEIPKFGDIDHNDNKMKINDSFKDQVNIVASIHSVFKEIKKQVIQKIDPSLIVEQMYNAFPFTSTCLSPPATSKHNYFIINTTKVEKWGSHNLQLGPVIIKGLDNLMSSDIIANGISSENKWSDFSMTIVTNPLYGQCDWKYYEDGKSRTTNHSFTFVIDNATFVANPKFHKNWIIDRTQIKLGSISIHRVNKSCPRIHEFTKDILREHLSDMIIRNLTDIFDKQYGKLKVNWNFSKTNEEIDKSATRTIVYWKNIEGYYTEENSDDAAGYTATDYLPLPTRRVAACKDKRNWFMRLFSRNKC